METISHLVSNEPILLGALLGSFKDDYNLMSSILHLPLW